ncbi:MAG: hypothetical protein ABH956_01525 [Candidatus Nealsonbacteria bacterium]
MLCQPAMLRIAMLAGIAMQAWQNSKFKIKIEDILYFLLERSWEEAGPLFERERKFFRGPASGEGEEKLNSKLKI